MDNKSSLQHKPKIDSDLLKLDQQSIIDLSNFKSITDRTDQYFPNIKDKQECEEQYKLGTWVNNKCWKDPEVAMCEKATEESKECKYNPYSGKYISTKYLQSQKPDLNAITSLQQLNMLDPQYQQKILEYFTGQLSPKMPVYQDPLAMEFVDACNQAKTITQVSNKNLPTIAQNLMNISGQLMLNQPQPHRGMLCFHSVGSGKSLARGSKVVMFNGDVKNVEDIEVGDEVMGDDSTVRNVVDLGRGRDQMYDIVPVKGEKYTVNSEHILCLRYSNKGFIKHDSRDKKKQKTPIAVYFNKQTIRTTSKSYKTKKEAQQFLDSLTEEDRTFEISVKNYLKLPKYIRDYVKGYRKGVEFSFKQVDFDPYIIGVWLGDGTAANTQITSQSHNIVKYLYDSLRQYDLFLDHQEGYHYKILSITQLSENNKFLNILKKHKLINNKHIPKLYKVNDRQIRLKILAGLIDTDGYYDRNCYDIIQKRKQLSDDILYLARSLGFAAYQKYTNKSCVHKGKKITGWYYRISISGEGLEEIPVQIRRKKAHKRGQIKDALVTGIKVQHVGVDDYYGIRLDGNHKYLLGDFTVTHNTCTSAALMDAYWNSNKRIYYITTYINLNAISPLEFIDCIKLFPNFKNLNTEESVKKWDERQVTFLSFQKASNLLGIGLKTKNSSIDAFKNSLLVIDEVQNIFTPIQTQKEGIDKLKKFLTQRNNPHLVGTNIFGLTGTPGNTPKQIVELLNMFRGPQQNELYVPTTDLEFDQFQKEILGMVSYVNTKNDYTRFPRVIDNDINMISMSEQQFQKYKEKMDEMKKTVKKETDFEYLSKQNQVEDYYKTLRRYSNMMLNFVKTDTLETYSNKLALLTNKIQQFPNDKQYIYSAFFRDIGNFGGQGVRSIGYALKQFLDYEQVTITDCYKAKQQNLTIDQFLTKNNKRFCLLLSTELEKFTEKQKPFASAAFLSYFNDPQNFHGEYIQLLLTSQKFNEGLDLKDIQHIHIFEPFVQKAADDQAIGRAARQCSHKNLKFPEEWIVHIHRYISDFPSTYKLFDREQAEIVINSLKKQNLEMQVFIQQMNQHLQNQYLNKEGINKINKDIQTYKLKMKNNNERIQTIIKVINNLDKEGNMIPIDVEILRVSQQTFGTLRRIYQIIKESAVDCILLNKLANYEGDCYFNKLSSSQQNLS